MQESPEGALQTGICQPASRAQGNTSRADNNVRQPAPPGATQQTELGNAEGRPSAQLLPEAPVNWSHLSRPIRLLRVPRADASSQLLRGRHVASAAGRRAARNDRGEPLPSGRRETRESNSECSSDGIGSSTSSAHQRGEPAGFGPATADRRCSNSSGNSEPSIGSIRIPGSNTGPDSKGGRTKVEDFIVGDPLRSSDLEGPYRSSADGLLSKAGSDVSVDASKHAEEFSGPSYRYSAVKNTSDCAQSDSASDDWGGSSIPGSSCSSEDSGDSGIAVRQGPFCCNPLFHVDEGESGSSGGSSSGSSAPDASGDDQRVSRLA